MAPKRKTSARDASTAKRLKKVMNSSHKMDLLDWLSRGQNVASVGRYSGVNESTVYYIRKNEKAIQESVTASTVPSTKVVTHVRDALTT